MENKNEKGSSREQFTLSLALVDALPVLFFAGTVVLGMKLRSALFFAGAVVCLFAGAGKVLWKLILALGGKDVRLLGAQLRYLMPLGFALMLVGAVASDRAVLGQLLHAAVRLPSALFFAGTVVGLAGMILCARRFDRRDVRGNWIEQGINAAAQGCALLGVLFL